MSQVEQDILSSDWQELPAHTRVWVYQSNRPLTDVETQTISKLGIEFVNGWASHGNELQAAFTVFHNRFVVIFVDEKQAMASGCSIDSSVKFIQDLGEQLVVDFFDRMIICYKVDDEIHQARLADIPALVNNAVLGPKTKVFNNLVASRVELEQSWLMEMGESWMKRYF